MNENATKVIDAYLDATTLAVPHAILVEGPWGSGKTHFLEKIYEPSRKKERSKQRLYHTPFLFVSLFGANSAADVEMRIYKAACPAEAVAGSIAGTLALGIGEFFRVKDTAKTAVEKIAKKATKRLQDFIFVFDDLERVEPNAFGEVMGLITSFVAQYERRVIVVADEQKLNERHGELWKNQHEKVVGRRARIEPDIEGVLEATVSSIALGSVLTFMRTAMPDLIETARASKVRNLRNLSWAIHNSACFAEALLGDEEIPIDHVMRSMQVVLAVTLHFRGGLLDKAALDKLPGSSSVIAMRSLLQRPREDAADQPLEVAQTFSATFKKLDVENPPVDYATIVDFEATGVLDAAVLDTWVKSKFGFGSQYEQAAWRRIWYAYERPVSETDTAIDRLAAELVETAHEEAGVILHAAGLAIKLREASDTRLTSGEEPTSFFKSYIDRLFDGGRLSATGFSGSRLQLDAYSGLGYSAKDTPEFSEIAGYLNAKRQAVAVALRDSQLDVVLREAEEGNVESLFEFVYSNEATSRHVPLLMGVDVGRMASLLTRDAPALSVGAKLIAYRYHDVPGDSPVLSEISWARAVYSAVLDMLEGWKEPHRTMAKSHFSGFVRHYDNEREPDRKVAPPAQVERDDAQPDVVAVREKGRDGEVMTADAP
ncbi:KAP-like P-loop domain-containing protein [Rhizobium sp. PP-F2F-G38]|nr:KAP-like P-loop domain-containing protein [Rhizobium sp. PP-F2F-G38]